MKVNRFVSVSLATLSVAVVAGGVALAAGTTNLDSLRVGTAGEGGVTFFNGSIVNEGEAPVTIADNLRVDGRISRLDGQKDKPVIVADNLEVEGSVTANNLYTKKQSDARYAKADEQKTGYYTVTPSDFSSAGNATFDANGTAFGSFLTLDASNRLSLRNTTSGNMMYVKSPIHLPHGATVTATTINYGLAGSTGSIEVSLQSRNHDNSSPKDLSTFSPNSYSNAFRESTVSCARDCTIDNKGKTYELHYGFEQDRNEDPSEIVLGPVTIEYTY